MTTKKRSNLWREYLPFVALGLGYLFFCLITGYSLPCPIHTVTGLYCPGCGATTLALNLVRGDFAAAYAANPMLFILLPLIIADTVYSDLNPKNQDNKLTYAIICCLVLYSFYRNLCR